MHAAESSEQLTLSAVVPTRGRAANLGVTLAALLTEPATSELIVVVDGGDPQSTALVSGLARSDPRVRLVQLSGPAGSDAGRQASAELARGQTILLHRRRCRRRAGLRGRPCRLAYRRHADGSSSGICRCYSASNDAPRICAAVFYDEGYELMCRSFDQAPTNVLLNFWAGDFSIARADALQVGLFDRTFGARIPRRS